MLQTRLCDLLGWPVRRGQVPAMWLAGRMKGRNVGQF